LARRRREAWALYDYTGTTFEDMQGWGWKSVHRSDLVDAVTERWQRSLATGEPFEMEFPLRGRDGQFRWFLTRIRALRDSEDRIVRWIGMNTDIDDHRRSIEAERQARDKAEEATRLKDEFLATLSHELRTPLNAILGWARMLQSGTAPKDQLARGLDTIVRNARAQNQLIDDLLDVSRIISGMMRLSVDTLDMAHVVATAIDVVQPAADAKGVRIQPVLDSAAIIVGDATRLQQVVWNLLTNAIKFTPKAGRVYVTLRRGDSFVELTISDTGAGISAEFLPYVFDRFRQQDGTISRRTGGLGLGLAIVKNLVELHGGRVDVTSNGEHKGATFTVRIPIAPIHSLSLQQERSSVVLTHQADVQVECPSEVRGLKVLVIDDESDTRELIRTVLEHCDATVTTVATVSEALAAVGPLKPDVIVSDIGMPDEDGYSFIKKLRALPREDGGLTPAVALTAYARLEDRKRALIAGFQTHAAKPVDPQELLVVIANLAGRYA
jgi:PAS domain S-box-containing protein